MTDGYDCYQNAMAERVNGILKTEFLLHRPKDLAEGMRPAKSSTQPRKAKTWCALKI